MNAAHFAALTPGCERPGRLKFFSRLADCFLELSMEKLVNEVKQFREERDWEQFHSPKNLAMALMVECAELAEHFQWLTEEQSRNLSAEKKEAIREEIGDVLVYLVNLSEKLGIDLLDAAWDKIGKNRKKYPVDKVRGKSSKYHEYE
jgi:NTP pyrophosphatase (non-canonical NTP hydrolase)